MNKEEIESLFFEVYDNLYLIPDKLREPLEKLGELVMQQMEKNEPEGIEQLIEAMKEYEMFGYMEDVLTAGILQLFVGLKHRAK